MFIYVLLTVSGLILFKLGTGSSQITIITKGVIGLQVSFVTLAGMLCYICSFFIYLFLVSKNTLSFLFPLMTGIVYVSVLTSSVLILKEKITPISLTGGAIILIGVILVIFQGN
jgi:drug/metabolite transporter (DMT)-like permease